MNVKFMQTLDKRVYVQLKNLADNRGVSLQEFLRAIVVPYWMKHSNGSDEGFLRHKARQARSA